MKLEHGPIEIIRVAPKTRQPAGKIYKKDIGPAIGFWLRDTPKDKVGDLCVRAAVVSTTKSELGLTEQEELNVGYLVEARADNKFRIISAAGNKLDSGAPGAFLLIQQQPDDQKVDTKIYAIFRWA